MKKFEYTEREVIESPVYETHKRGRNWCALLEGENSVKVIKIFQKMKGSAIDTSSFKEGRAVEFGGDYISGGGVRHPNREYYVIESIREDGIEAEEYPTIAQAMKARKNGI